jgi:D-alanine-D-alanine ligase
MEIGLAFDLKQDFLREAQGGPEDRLEEYDSPETVAALEQALQGQGHRVRRLGGGRRFVERLLERPPELVFNIAEGFGTRSREAHVPAVCEMLRVPCTHSDPLTCALTLDKAMAKRVVASAGVRTPRFAVVDGPAEVARLELAYPVIAKPLAEGSSMGVRSDSRCTGPRELETKVAQLAGDYRQAILVEEFCPGAEITVGVLGSGARARVAGMMEIRPKRRPPGEFVYSLDVKREWEEEISLHAPPDQPQVVVEEAAAVALAAYRALGVRDVGRVDVRLDARGRPAFLELNPLPGMRPAWSDLCLAVQGAGMSYPALVGAIVAEARARCGL